jgi:hypothetical protein
MSFLFPHDSIFGKDMTMLIMLEVLALRSYEQEMKLKHIVELLLGANIISGIEVSSFPS